MRNGLLAWPAILAFTSVLVCRPSPSSASAADLWPVEATVRKADADWAVAANSASVDAWLAFYTADTVVRLPNDNLASGRELLRHTVTHLLGLPHVSVAWRPIKVEVAPSGDQALLLDSFELRFSDLGGAPVLDRGRRLEIWRKQPDGAWKCIVDAWNLDEAIAAPEVVAPAVAAPAVAPPSVAAPVAAPLAQSAPSSSAVPETGPPKPAPATKYGEMPTFYQDTIRKYFLKHLKYPDSIQYREITNPEQGYTTAVTGTILMRETRTYGWTVKASINAKNSPDTYVGFKTYTFLFRGEKIVDARLPLPAGEIAEPTPD
jgi:ketosteroid isomerase-like protein